MNLNFEQMTDEYLHHLQSRSSERHARAKQVLLSFQEDTKVETLDESDGHLVFNWITTQDWSSSTMRMAWLVFTGMIRYANRGSFPLRGRMPLPEQTKPSLITAEQHAALVAAASPELANVLRMLWVTGARQGEIASAQVDQIRTTEHGIMIVLDQQQFNSQPRVIYMPPKTADLIRSLAATHEEGPIFRNASGNAWTTDALRNALLRLCRKAGVCFHPWSGYRKAMANRLRETGVAAEVFAVLLGQVVPAPEVNPNDERIWEAVRLLEERP